MNTKLERSRAAKVRVPLRFAMATVGVVALIVLAGCGGSSKPAYCTDRTNLENSVKGLTSLKLSSGISGISGLQSQAKTIQSDATSLANSAKGDFPSQTSDIKASVNDLSSALKAITSTPSASQIASVATSAASVATSVKSFVDASSSKCS
jgi:hypothetical protein